MKMRLFQHWLTHSLIVVSITAISSTRGAAQTPEVTADSATFFETRIRPLLSQSCYSCHQRMHMGGLEMQSREALLKGGAHGPAIVPGHPEESLLIQAVEYKHPKIKMPPNGKLNEGDIALLTSWIKAGAIWPETPAVSEKAAAESGKQAEYSITSEQRKFWSFQPVRKPALPEVKNSAWVRNDIDRFILAKLEEKGLKPVRPADRRTLIRRATFDLTGLPPTPDEIETFLKDQSPDAFVKVVDRLLASPRYGERWGRYWLDIVRYADSKAGFFEDPYPNAFRYRDWVIQALNQDMPYNTFLKAQVAADLLPISNTDESKEKLLPALGFQSLGNLGFGGMGNDDRVDVLTRGVMGITVACAQCHDHKYDPIPTKDFYSLLGVFKNTESDQYPLASPDVVAAYDGQMKKIAAMEALIRDFEEKQNNILTDIFTKQTSRYMVASWKVLSGLKTEKTAAAEDKLDGETLGRWVKYLKDPNKDHPFLRKWYETTASHPTVSQVKAVADEFQTFFLSVCAEKKAIDDRNYVKLGGATGVNDDKKRRVTELEFLDGLKGRLWADLAGPQYMNVGDGIVFPRGVFYYGPERMGTDEAEKVRQMTLAEMGVKDRPKEPIERFLYGEWKTHLETMFAELDSLKKALPPPYPFLHAVKDVKNPANIKVQIRGEETNLGEEAPRRFLQVLCESECKPFTHGSGRLELAEAIASPDNPLTSRVIVNRIWAHHFGEGIVRSQSNFGLLGEKPTHPELLDYLASRLVDNRWSLKDLHRQILMSATYALSSDQLAENNEKDAENRLHWRANIEMRLDVESLRDALLTVSGQLDDKMGGPPVALDDKNNHRRTVYGLVNRRRLDGTLALFDFPDPSATSEGRVATTGPLQRLYFLNNAFVATAADGVVKRVSATGADPAKIDQVYRILFGRPPAESEQQLGLQFLKQGANSWPEYVQVLLSSSEFMSVN
ncbi:MAG: hypothetical protein QOJ99_3307 [Bryobacterales bacterium]|nr:hypothetical protein [Bryobacterales bacterium]